MKRFKSSPYSDGQDSHISPWQTPPITQAEILSKLQDLLPRFRTAASRVEQEDPGLPAQDWWTRQVITERDISSLELWDGVLEFFARWAAAEGIYIDRDGTVDPEVEGCAFALDLDWVERALELSFPLPYLVYHLDRETVRLEAKVQTMAAEEEELEEEDLES